MVLEFGFLAISMKVRKFGSLLSFGELSASKVLGTLWIAFAKLTTASVLVVRYFTNSQAAVCFWLPRAMPMMVPVW